MMKWALIDPDSMVYIAENLPIVYYLAPSNFYPDVVSELQTDVCAKLSIRPKPNIRDVEKENLINAAIATGLYQPARPVSPAATADERAKLAVGASEWHEKWWDCGRRNAYGVYWQKQSLQAYNQRELTASDNLLYQGSARLQSTIGWNTTIAANASRFHSQSEATIDNSPVELYIFWSQKNPTTGSVDMQFDGAPEKMNILAMGVAPVDYINQGKYPQYTINTNFDFRFQWWMSQSERQWVKVTGKLVDGDGTVPRASLLGIGTSKAKIFQPIPGDPAHVPAPNADYVWDRVLDVLTGRDVAGYVVEVKPENQPWK